MYCICNLFHLLANAAAGDDDAKFPYICNKVRAAVVCCKNLTCQDLPARGLL